MNAGLFAAVSGLIAAAVCLFMMFYALGFFQYLGGNKMSNIAPVSKEQLINRILALNDSSKPYSIVRDVDSDLVAEWKIVDAKWYGIFSKSRLKEAYRASLLVDESRHSVRCYEELSTITFVAGLSGLSPSVNYERNFFRGRILYKKEYAKGYGIKQLRSLEAGKVYDYRFDINEIRGPIILTVEDSGWEWVPVTVKRHAHL